jgi:hydroxyacylglutathione hydrolase
MTIKIHVIHLGLDQCYIVQDDGTIMIDGGSPGKINKFKRALHEISMAPEDIQLIAITHGHWDHIGCASGIKELTRAKIAMHRLDKERLEKPLKVMPPGVNAWGVLLEKATSLVLPFVHIPRASVDLVIGDEGLSLSEYGVPGRVIHTPGHSPGSVSVLLDSGEAFVGDMAMNRFPLRYGANMPVFAEDFAQLKESWRMLLNQGARTIYPAHGKPFSSDIIRKVLS